MHLVCFSCSLLKGKDLQTSADWKHQPAVCKTPKPGPIEALHLFSVSQWSRRFKAFWFVTVNIWYTHFVILIWFALKVIFRQRDPPGNCYVLCEGTCIAQRKLGLPCWSGHQIHDIGWQHVIFVRKSMWCVNDLSLNDHISHIQHKIPMNIMVVSDVILHISSSHWNVIIPCYPPIFRHHCGSGLMSTSAAKRWMLQIPQWSTWMIYDDLGSPMVALF